MDQELYRNRKPAATAQLEGLGLFAQQNIEADIARDVERLTTLAGELALKAGAHGVTVSDLRVTAVHRGILTGEESEARIKQLNLGAAMAKAGLFATSNYRRSDVARAHRNLNVVWVTEEHSSRRAS